MPREAKGGLKASVRNRVTTRLSLYRTAFCPFMFLSTKALFSLAAPPPPHFCVMRFWGQFFLRENVNLMHFVRDVVIESLVVIRYRVYFCT